MAKTERNPMLTQYLQVSVGCTQIVLDILHKKVYAKKAYIFISSAFGQILKRKKRVEW